MTITTKNVMTLSSIVPSANNTGPNPKNVTPKYNIINIK
jgi:hypothetical protein